MNIAQPIHGALHERRRDYRSDIDGLRAIAVTSVVLFHAGLFPFRSGFVGVDVFFVISGYLIGGIILRETREGRFSFAEFYARRARRILPALILVVLSTCVAGWFLLDAGELKDVGVTGTLALVGASNINFWQFQDYFAHESSLRVLLMTWSLGVEEQFYLLFPLIAIVTGRAGSRWPVPVFATLAILSLGVSVWWTRSAPSAAFYLLPSRAWELGAGVILAATEVERIDFSPIARLLVRHKDALAATGLGLVVFAVVAFDEAAAFPGWRALVPVLGTVVLIASRESRINRHVLGSRPMVFVGLVSYSWYLWHWPLMSLLRIVVAAPLPPRVFVGVAAVSFGLAVLTWRFVERPFRRGRREAKGTLLCYGAALALAIAVPFAIKTDRGVPGRLSPQARRMEAIATELRAGRCLVSAGPRPTDNPDCRSFPENRPVVALFGDSHAWALGPGLRAVATKQGLGFEILARAACPPLLGVTVESTAFPRLRKECAAFNPTAVAAIAKDPRILTVILAGFWSAPVAGHLDSGYTDDNATSPQSGLELLRAGLSRMVAALTAAHKHVVLVDDVPAWSFNPLDIALAQSMPVRGALARLFDPDVDRMRRGWAPVSSVVRHDDVRQILATVAAGNPDVRLLDLFARFCDDSRCIFNAEGEPLFFDKDHVSAAGSERALNALRLTE